MKIKRTESENGTITSEWELDIVGFTLTITQLIQVLYVAGII